MTGGRDGGRWLGSFSLSIVAHSAIIAYVVAPMISLASLDSEKTVPLTMTLTTLEVSAPDTIELPGDPVAVPVPDEQPPAPAADEIAATAPEEITPESPSVEEIAPVAPVEEQIASVVAPEEDVVTQPDPVAPAQVAAIGPPEPISALRPDTDEIASIAGSAAVSAAPYLIAPVGSEPVDQAVQPAVSASAVEVISPVTSPVTSIVPPEVPPAPPPPDAGTVSQQQPGGQSDPFLARIRGQLALPCLVAYPKRSSAGTTALEFVAANEADIRSFAGELLANVSPVPPQTAELIDARQCDALNFVRESAQYPAFSLAVNLTSADIASGERLTGTIDNAGGAYVSLMVVDDNGVVQDLGQYMSFVGAQVRFDVPMSRFGGARDTRQLLLAIASGSRPTALDTHNGFLAADFFPKLRESVDRRARLALVPFSLR